MNQSVFEEGIIPSGKELVLKVPKQVRDDMHFCKESVKPVVIYCKTVGLSE